MNSEPSNAAPVALPEGRFSGRSEFNALVRQALAAAAAQGWSEVIWCDPDFADWPLGERAVSESLRQWSAAGRHCTLLACRYDEMAVRHARFATWRRTWSHIVDARGVSSADPLEFPSAIWSPGWVMQRLDPQRCNGVSGAEPERRLLLKENLQAWLAKSSASFPATTLGL